MASENEPYNASDVRSDLIRLDNQAAERFPLTESEVTPTRDLYLVPTI